MLQSILNQLDHVLLQSNLDGKNDEQYLEFLGMTDKALSGKGLESMKGPSPSKIKPGKFIYYNKKLALCLSKCNPVNECSVLIVTIQTHKIDATELKKTDINISVTPKKLLDIIEIVNESSTMDVSGKAEASAAVSEQAVASAAVSKKAAASAGVSKKAAASAGVSKKAAASAGVSKKAAASAGVSKKAAALVAVSEQAAASVAVSEQAAASVAVSEQAAASAAKFSNKDVVKYGDKLLTVKQILDGGTKLKCNEYIANIESVTIDIGTCVLLEHGSESCLSDRIKDTPVPSKVMFKTSTSEDTGDLATRHGRIEFVDDGFFDGAVLKEFQKCNCTFLKMMQHEIIFGVDFTSIKRYFCNDPYKQTKTTEWKIYCGSISNLSPEKTFRCLDDKYTTSRSNEFVINNDKILEKRNSHLFINIYIILYHWVRHDADKPIDTDRLLWDMDQVYVSNYCYSLYLSDEKHGSRLREHDFTITQCLMFWAEGVINKIRYYAKYYIEDVKQKIKKDIKDAIKPIIDDLNTMITSDESEKTFSNPIFAAFGDVETQSVIPGESNYNDYKTRAINIIRKAVELAFPFYKHDNEKLFFDSETFIDNISDYYLKRIHISPTYTLTYNTLEKCALSALVGGTFPEGSTQYTVIRQHKRRISVPYELIPDEIILIYNKTSVHVAYFHWTRYIHKIDTLRYEMNTRIRNRLTCYDLYDVDKYNIYFPVIYYNNTPGNHSINDPSTREIFNVYTIRDDE